MIKRLLLTLTATLACLSPSVHAAISITSGGAGPFTFDTAPDVSQWSAKANNPAGAAGDITPPAVMDQRIGTNTAAMYTPALTTPTGTAGAPPAAARTPMYT